MVKSVFRDLVTKQTVHDFFVEYTKELERNEASILNNDKLFEIYAEYLFKRNELQSAQPKRKNGRWIFCHPLQENDGGGCMCSECKTGWWDVDRWNYCPNCGADMRSEENDQQ